MHPRSMPRRTLRLALVHPTYWPEVRRGSERLLHDLATTLAARGHEVTLLTTHPGRSTSTVEQGVRIVRSRRPPEPPPRRLNEYFLATAPGVAWHLLGESFDVAHAFFPTDAWAAVAARRLGGPPVAFSFHGIPTRPYLVARRHRLEMITRAVEGAAACTVLSEAAARPFRRYLLREPAVIPPGVLVDEFGVREPRSPVPTLLCAASLGDPRKRAGLLLSAFERLRERRRDARLLVVRGRDPVMGPSVPRLPAGAEWLEADRTDVLARAYAAAWTSVLPAVDEAFGIVLTESLAAGTPVVAARSGAGPEIVSSDAVGRLFEPDDEISLVEAMDEALGLALHEGTTEACRSRAADYDWSRAVVPYEDLYDSVLGGPAAGSSG